MGEIAPYGAFRQYLPDLRSPRFKQMQNQNAHQYAEAFRENKNPPWIYALWEHWRSLFAEPFKGVTSDGRVREHLFALADEGIAIDDIVQATQSLLSMLSPEQRSAVLYHLDSPDWRTWSNPEFLLSNKGIRLDEVNAELRSAVLGILKATLSPEGYEKAISAMRINGFLGELVGAPAVCNEYSYNFAIFGTPSNVRPWGFTFYGHHLCMNAFLYKSQIVLSPWFTGAEPNEIDTGPYKGTSILQREEFLGLKLMQSLPPAQQSLAQIYKLMKDPDMPVGRWNHDDQRHLCGAFRDNRIVPYEGILVSDMEEEHVSLVEQILEEYLLYLPATARALRLSQARRSFDETYFCWIGGFAKGEAFYYRIQSPVIIVEFDHHSGVFLTNDQPARFHIHTLLRTPNGGDYGKALIPMISGEKQAFIWSKEE